MLFLSARRQRCRCPPGTEDFGRGRKQSQSSLCPRIGFSFFYCRRIILSDAEGEPLFVSNLSSSVIIVNRIPRHFRSKRTAMTERAKGLSCQHGHSARFFQNLATHIFDETSKLNAISFKSPRTFWSRNDNIYISSSVCFVE